MYSGPNTGLLRIKLPGSICDKLRSSPNMTLVDERYIKSVSFDHSLTFAIFLSAPRVSHNVRMTSGGSGSQTVDTGVHSTTQTTQSTSTGTQTDGQLENVE